MRSKSHLILAGLGAFLLMTAVLLRFYAYPQLAVAPPDQDSTTTLVGPGATILDVTTGQTYSTDLTTTVVTKGDVQASEEASTAEGKKVVVWASSSSTKDSDGKVVSRSLEREAFGANDAVAINCCDEYLETQATDAPETAGVQHQGLLSKFPFQTQKKTYDFWDSTLLKAMPIGYVGTEKVDGVTTYKFATTIEPTKFADVDAPAAYLGLDQTGNVPAQRYYSNTRTLWVEPNTGVVIKRTEAQLLTLRYEGVDKLTTTQVTTGYDDATVKANADEYGSKGKQLALVHGTLPVASGVLGALLLLAGLFGASRRQHTTPTARKRDKEPAGA